ncbi:adenylate/guanylate cyclase domain-containing protein [Fontimonas sp. SYSU GA230001]|uniref:CHASE2 domain-containing protein n=1 Tax=Fontimonas sp. SYSU GA230001 TaxID=3142450 RepID=UPI0032B4425B
MTARSLIRLAISAAVFALFLVHSARWLPWRLLDVIEDFTYDARVLLTLPGTGDPRVVIVDLDERSLAAEGWPWPRTKFATLVDQLFDRYRIRTLGFDIVFAEPDDQALRLWARLSGEEFAAVPEVTARADEIRRELDHDARFAQALQGRAVVMGYFFRPTVPADEDRAKGAICAPLIDAQAARLYDVDFVEAQGYGGNVAQLQQAAAGCGFFDNPIAALDDGVFRRVPLVQRYDGAIYPSLALAIVAMALGNPPIELEFEPPEIRTSLHLERVRIGPLSAPVDEYVAAYVPYRGDNRTFTYVSAVDVLRGEVERPERLRDAIVLMGATAAGLLDLRSTPVNKVFSGVEVHANLVSGMLDGRIRQKAPYYSGIETVMHLLIAIALAWAFARLSAAASAALGFGLIAGIVGLAFALWSGADFIMPLGVPVTFTLSLFMAHLLYGYFVESRGKREISKLFGQYVPPEVVAELAEHPEAVSMAGESREMTVLFSDVRGFTSISESLDARAVAELMNRFLTQQTGVIQRHRGTIDKYMGDAIMAFWGAPLPDGEHALHALQAGLDMIRSVRELDAEFDARGWPRLQIGVGINSGRMSVGNMGSEFRMAYTVMGDAVNLGSRLEGLTKEYGAPIVCSEATRSAAPADWSFRELDLVRVKGKQEPVAIYEPMGPKDGLDPALRQDLARHRGALKLYRAQRWDEAELEFFNLSQSGRPHRIYELFIERIMYLREHPPGADWDGAFTFTHK